MMLTQKVEKKSVQVYLFYPKSYNKLKHEEMLLLVMKMIELILKMLPQFQ